MGVLGACPLRVQHGQGYMGVIAGLLLSTPNAGEFSGKISNSFDALSKQ